MDTQVITVNNEEITHRRKQNLMRCFLIFRYLCAGNLSELL